MTDNFSEHAYIYDNDMRIMPLKRLFYVIFACI